MKNKHQKKPENRCFLFPAQTAAIFLAAALLLQGQEEPAANIYRRYRGSLKDEFLGDLQQLESLGIIPSESCDAVERIKTIINQHTLK